MPAKSDSFRGLLQVMQVRKRHLVFWTVAWIVIAAAFLASAIKLEDLDALKGANRFLDLLLQVVTGILAAFVFAYLYQNRERSVLERIQSAGHQELLEVMIEDVAHYQGIYCESHSMVATLQRHPATHDYYLCRIQHEYNKSKVEPTFVAKIYRIKKGQTDDGLPDIASEALTSEFVWYNDEREFASPPNDDDYRIPYVTVSGYKVSLKKEIKDRVIVFSGELPPNLGEMPRVTFEFICPMERESILQLTAEFPSRGGAITFDVSKVPDQLIVYPLPMIGFRANPIDLSNPTGGQYKYEYPGWALPKDGCVFAWWLKK